MRKGILVLVTPLFVLSPAWSVCNFDTNPLDCIQLYDPALGKQIVWGPAQTHCGEEQSLFISVRGSGSEGPAAGTGFDAAGNFYALDNYFGTRQVYRFRPNGTRELIAEGVSDGPYGMNVDTTNGRIYLSTTSGGCTPGTIIAITGLPTLFDVVQTYTPSATNLRISVPAHPEGLRRADHFDTYWGRVSDLPDFTQAHPVQCDYPDAPPTAGTYLTVADTSPIPAPGQANYIVTAGSEGTQRRYGRQLIGGVLSGRNPALLPVCP